MRLYRLLLLLYPRRFRDRYGAAMLQAFADGRRAARLVGPGPLVRFYASSVSDLVLNACAERAGLGPRVASAHGRAGLRSGLVQDVRFAFRMLWRRPALAFFSIGTLALGLGAVTAIASLAYAVLLQPLPFPEPDRIVSVRGLVNSQPAGISFENLRDLRERSATLEALTPFFAQSVNLTGVPEPDRLRGAFVTSDFFTVVGAEASLGRLFGRESDAPGSERAAVLSHGLWRRRFGGRPDAAGMRITLNNAPFTVIGVMPAGFDFPIDEAEVFLPFWTAPVPTARDRHNYIGIGRLTPRTHVREASAELAAIAAQLARSYPDANRGRSTHVQSLKEVLAADLTAPLMLLLGMVGLMLAAACANVTGLQLGAIAARRREIAIRAALGAGTARVVRQLLIENVVRALAGAVLGIVAGIWAVRFLATHAPEGLYGIEDAAVRPSVVLLAIGAALMAGVLAGLPPALQWSRAGNLSPADADGRAAGDSRTSALRSAIVGSQLALAGMLLVAAGLTARSFVRLLTVELGFEPGQLLTMEYRLPGNKYTSGGAQAEFHREVVARARAVPGVIDAAGVRALPLSGNGSVSSFRVPERRERQSAAFNTVSDRYFAVMRIPLLAGRTFAATEPAPVVVVSRSFAASTWPGGNPLGRQVIFDEAEITATVIGVVGDVRHRDLTDEDARTIYASHDQNPGLFNTLVVRTSVPPLGVADAVRHAVWEVDADQPVWKIRSLDALVARWLSARQFLLQLVMFFGLSAAALSVVGLYGVVAANVSQRTREMGIRVALGATRGALLRLVLWQGARIGALGIGGGLAAALLFAQGLQGFLYGIDARDPLTFAATGAILLLAALAASLGPARRATRVDAALLLRQ